MTTGRRASIVTSAAAPPVTAVPRIAFFRSDVDGKVAVYASLSKIGNDLMFSYSQPASSGTNTDSINIVAMDEDFQVKNNAKVSATAYYPKMANDGINFYVPSRNSSSLIVNKYTTDGTFVASNQVKSGGWYRYLFPAPDLGKIFFTYGNDDTTRRIFYSINSSDLSPDTTFTPDATVDSTPVLSLHSWQVMNFDSTHFLLFYNTNLDNSTGSVGVAKIEYSTGTVAENIAWEEGPNRYLLGELIDGKLVIQYQQHSTGVGMVMVEVDPTNFTITKAVRWPLSHQNSTPRGVVKIDSFYYAIWTYYFGYLYIFKFDNSWNLVDQVHLDSSYSYNETQSLSQLMVHQGLPTYHFRAFLDGGDSPGSYYAIIMQLDTNLSSMVGKTFSCAPPLFFAPISIPFETYVPTVLNQTLTCSVASHTDSAAAPTPTTLNVLDWRCNLA